MSTPTQTENETKFNNSTKFLEAVRIRGTLTTTYSVEALMDALIQSAEGVYSEDWIKAAKAIRKNYSDSIAPAKVQALLGPILKEEARRIGLQTSDVNALLSPSDDGTSSLYDDFIANGRWLDSRAISWGTLTAGGSNVGNGEMLRVTVDANGVPLEGAYAPKDTPITVACTRDANGGATVHEETFEIRGRDKGADELDEKGSGLKTTSRSKSSNQSTNKLNNPSFSQRTPTTDNTTLTALSGWTVTTSISNIKGYTSDYYRSMGAETTPGCIEFQDNETITTQYRIRSVDRTKPHVIQVAFKRENSCDGTLTLTVGAVSKAVTLSAQSGWTILRIDLDENSWPASWDTSGDVKLSIALASRTTGQVKLDDIVFEPMDYHDGAYYAPVGGSTRWAVADVYTSSDSETGAVNNRWLSRGWPGKFLPSVADATQVTAAGGRTLTFASSGNTCTASSGSFITDGYKVGMVLTVAGTSSNNGTYTITAVTATVITVSSGFTNEGPLSSTATLDAAADFSDPTVA